MSRKSYAAVLSIAGSDCSGGAGIQADIKAISALGGYAATAVTAITVQNTCGVYSVHPLPPEVVRAQMDAVMQDIRPEAVKIGMVHDAETIGVIAASLRRYSPRWVVLDPVMVSTSGKRLLVAEATEALQTELMPLADLLTPNLPEAHVLTRMSANSPEEMMEVVRRIHRMSGCRAVLLKGGHLEKEELTDILYDGKEPPVVYHSRQIKSRNTHGTGCTLSAAIACLLAQGLTMEAAVGGARQYLYGCILHGKEVHTGNGNGPVNHLFAPVAMKIMEGEENENG